jgi:serine phosphatase RsbU (regulator of sigma subunit)
MFRESEFPATRLQLEARDTLFIYTDGLSEARGAGDEYSVDRIARFMHQQAGRPAAEIIAACLDDLRAFTEDSPRMDDLTLLAIQRC